LIELEHFYLTRSIMPWDQSLRGQAILYPLGEGYFNHRNC